MKLRRTKWCANFWATLGKNSEQVGRMHTPRPMSQSPSSIIQYWSHTHTGRRSLTAGKVTV